MPQFALYPIIIILSVGGAEAVLKWGKTRPGSYFSNEDYWETFIGIALILLAGATLI